MPDCRLNIAVEGNGPMRRMGTILTIALLSGCASMSKEECLYADWRAIGYEDGARGAPVSAISSRRQACVKQIGAAPDMSEYLAGREQGLRQYCQPSNGFRLGADGGNYFGVCTGPEGDTFAVAYESGRHLYDLESSVNSVGNAIAKAQKNLKAVKYHITEVEAALISPETPIPARIELLAELKNFSEERGRIETAIVALTRDHARAEDELADYQAFIAENGPYPTGALRSEADNYSR
jgi:hypothetical protein